MCIIVLHSILLFGYVGTLEEVQTVDQMIGMIERANCLTENSRLKDTIYRQRLLHCPRMKKIEFTLFCDDILHPP